MRRVDLVPGWTAARWWTVTVTVSCLSALPLATIALWAFRVDDDSRIVPTLAGVGLISLAEYVPVLNWLRAQRREAAAGYTTLRRPRDLILHQVDPATGVVIREGGTPFLSPAEYRSARARAQNPLAF